MNIQEERDAYLAKSDKLKKTFVSRVTKKINGLFESIERTDVAIRALQEGNNQDHASIKEAQEVLQEIK